MAQYIVFLSHAASEAPVAKILKDEIEAAFLGIAEVFVSSDPRSLPPGKRWLDAITAKLHEASIMLVLASPVSIGRPWVNFEAGAAWIRRIDVVPLCHSGITPSTLPVPLREFEAVEILRPDDLRNLVKTVSQALGCREPNLDFEALSQRIGEAVRSLPAEVTKASVAPGLRDRVLSPERADLEGRVHAAILRMQSLRTAGAKGNDRALVEKAVGKAAQFLSEPESIAPDQPLRAYLAELEAAIADLSDTQSSGLEQEMLKELREMARRQARSSEILTLNLDAFAARHVIERDVAQDVLVDLLNSGKAEPYAPTFGQSAEAGSARITQLGMSSIDP